MSNQTFLTLNSPSIEQRVGIYLVPKVLANAQPWLVLEKTALVTPLPKHKGEILKWKRNVPFDASTTELVEGVTPPPSNFRQEIIEDRIKQYGAVVNFSDKVTDLHEDPIADEIAKEMAKQMAKTKEVIGWEVVRAGTQVIYSGTATSRSQVIAPIDIDQVRAAVALLKANYAEKVTPRIGAQDGFATTPVNSSYVAVGHTDQEGDIRDLDTFSPVEAYAGGSRPISEYEIGKVDEVRVILSPDLEPFYDAGAAVGVNDVKSRGGVNANVYPLVVMGKDAWGMTELKGMNAAEVTIQNPKMQVTDPLGQRGFAAWKMYYTATRLNESWMVRIESAATDY